MKTLTIIKSNIKGYHSFKIRPHCDIEMDVVVEEDNSYDPYAMAVNMPLIQEIHPRYHDVVTREEKGKYKKQSVRDIAGKQVGRVPANLCKMFRKVLHEKDVVKIKCSSLDDPHLSGIPPPQESFKRNPRGKDRRGGGAVIACKYTLHCHDTTYEKVVQYMVAALKELQFQGEEEVKIDVKESTASCPW